ncbi:hypothetical protein ABDJ41_12875 [Pedobacter sp. ASV1-7]|uniref:hypothetical protein n=1 Tax=Pedobacter sp. ASV1-7 TaxID=3145237 RepID=UPI0032E8DCB0
MKLKYLCIAMSWILILVYSCKDKTEGLVLNNRNDLIITNSVTKASPFVGIGPQWGGYDNVFKWTGSNTLSEADWNTLFKRVEFLKPGLIRLMASPGWNYIVDGQYNPHKSDGVLFKILDFCQQKGIKVMFGEWGEPALPGNQVDVAWLDKSTNFLSYLINDKAYTCIKYYNMCNEPAGSWSSIAGDYDLWQRTYVEILKKMESKNLTNKITVIAPDIAVWNDNSLGNWITRAKGYFGDKIGAYDIHTYPTDDQVKGGNYKKVLADYRSLVPDHMEMIMGELGFKYSSNSDLGKDNLLRISQDQHTSDDSNMMIYDAFYGVDMADAIIQNMDAGYNGVILWNMDDAMYDDGNNKLKRWGFWNILGQEKFGGVADEAIRPWFYPMSLMCRYFPTGATIYQAKLPNKKGVQAIAAMKDGKYTIAISNSHAVTYQINLKMEAEQVLNNAKVFRYVAGEGVDFEGSRNADGFAIPAAQEIVDFSKGKHYPVTIKGKSFTLITNMDF